MEVSCYNFAQRKTFGFGLFNEPGFEVWREFELDSHLLKSPLENLIHLDSNHNLWLGINAMQTSCCALALPN